MNKIDLALEIATKAHKNQVDKAGKDYINHPIRVASTLKNEDEKIVALLHDTIEDTSITPKDLEDYGFSKEIIEAILCISRKDEESYDDFILRVKQNPLATKVKIADLLDNLDITRLDEITKYDKERVAKYLKALKTLIF